MKNLMITPVTDPTWQLPLTTVATSAAASALPLAGEGIAVRTSAPNAFGAFAAGVVAAEQPVKRDRAFTGMGHRGIAATVPGSLTWSPPI